MSALLVAVLAFAGFLLAYRFYSRFLSERLFGLRADAEMPSHKYRDGVDYVPTDRHILMGHHYTSIAGAAPIVGPAIAIIWGWLPAVLWIVFGSIFMGAVHDFSSLVVSARHEGRSIGEITEDIIGPTARTLFLVIIFFLLLIVIAVFALIIGIMFTLYPASVLPIWFEIPLAVAVGYFVYARKGNVALWSIAALVVMYLSIYAGTKMPLGLDKLGVPADSVLTWWLVILLVYAYVASTLPVQYLLQPRDFINSHELYAGLAVMFVALVFVTFTSGADFVAPALNLEAEGAPMIFPFLFITIACGAISGFHSLVSSGTTVKQLDRETDARPIGYGSMLLEGVLSIMAIVACGAGFASTGAWNTHYASWSAASGLGPKIGAFIEGCAYFISHIGIGHELAAAIAAVVVVSFAATTLDSATRIQRYVVQELAGDFKIPVLGGRHPATLVAVGTALALALAKGRGKGGLVLWPVFGTTNQLLAGLALMVVTVYLVRRGRNTIYTLLPMVFMIVMTGWAALMNLRGFFEKSDWLLTGISGVIMLIEVWLIVEGIKIAVRYARGGRSSPAAGN